MTMASWHESVLAAADEAGPVTQPGKFWEQVASNLFLENLRSRLWGWVEPRSVWLLDFWQQFEPKLHFVLVYTSSQRALAMALASGLDESDIPELLNRWHAHHQEMLRFHNRNPHRTMLLDAEK